MNKTILITGATKGIGLATAQRLYEKGYFVVGIARHFKSNFPGQLFLVDLTKIDETEAVLFDIKSQYSIDGIINNVGIAAPEPLGQINLSTFQTVYDLNVRTAIQITQAFIENMKSRQWGRIINMASRAIFGVKNRTSYSAAKSALIGCTRTWALELAKERITVNAIAPGPIDTELFRQSHPIGSNQEKQVLEKIPLGRFGKPDEIASIIEFLLSEEAGFITGQTICVDGGASIIG